MFSVVLLLAVLCLLVNSSNGLVIDDFDSGSLLLRTQTYTPGAAQFQTGLDPASVVGGARDVYVRSFKEATLEIAPSTGELVFNAVSDMGYFGLEYGAKSPLNLNLLANGGDSFLLTFSGLELTGTGIIWIHVYTSGGSSQASISDELRALNGPGSIRIPFSQFSSSRHLTSVEKIQISGGRISSPARIAITSIETVPEPSAGLLSAMGVVILLNTRGSACRPAPRCISTP